MSTAVIHLNLSLEKFCLKSINANIVVHKVRLIGFSPHPPVYFVSCVQYSSSLCMLRNAVHISRDCISLALIHSTSIYHLRLHRLSTADHLSLNSAGCLVFGEFSPFHHSTSSFLACIFLTMQIKLTFSEMLTSNRW